MLARVLRYSRFYDFYQRAFRRHGPEAGPVFLGQRRVYILPTRQGVIFAVALLLMLIGSINYNLSLGYVLTFLLGGLGVVSILHTFRNLAYLYVSPGRVESVFAGDCARFGVILESQSRYDRFTLRLYCRGNDAVTCDVPAQHSMVVSVPVKAEKRGWLQLDRVTLETRYPLGLARAWSYVQPDMRALIFPRPDRASLPPDRPVAEAGESLTQGAGSDDFAGLRPYQPGDSPRHIAWKAAARGSQVLTKTFSGQAATELWFEWEALPPDMGVEARLSRLARWVLLADEQGLQYGLRIPGGSEMRLGHGREHLARCLTQLALYDVAG